MTNARRRQNGKGAKSDLCYTPAYALQPILDLLPNEVKVWEPAAGRGDLVRALLRSGKVIDVISGDLATGQNFLTSRPAWHPIDWDCIITNPPYSIIEKWLHRCFYLGKPWALLCKHELDATQQAQRPFVKHGRVHKIVLDKRIDYATENTSFENSSGWFPSAWYLWPKGWWGVDNSFVTTSRVIIKKL